MKITRLILVVATLTFAFASCEKSSSDKGLANAIPANTGYVIHVNAKSLVEKSNYDIFQNVTVQRGINMAKAMIGSEQVIVDMIDAFTKDVNSLGLNLKNDCYFYTDYNQFGMVLGVNDAEKLKNSILNIPGAKEQELIKTDENGINSISPQENVAIVWNKEKFIVVGNIDMYGYKNKDNKDLDVLAMAKKQLTQGEKESINSKPAFANFLKEQKDISVFYAYSPDMVKTMISSTTGQDLPAEITKELEVLEGITSVAYISFDKGEIKGEGKVYYDTPEAEKKYKELSSSICGTLKGEQLKYIPENPMFLVSANIKGAGIYDFVKRLNVLDDAEKGLLEEGINLQSLMSNLDGDISFALTDILSVKKSYSYGKGETYEYDSSFPEMSLLIDLKNGKEALDLLKSKLTEDESDSDKAPKAIDDNTYTIDMDGTKAYFGLANNTAYLTNSENVYNGLKSSTPISKGYDALAKNNMGLIAGNIQSLKEPVLKQISDDKAKGLTDQFISLFGTYSYTASTEMGGNGTLEMTDKNENSLASIFKYVDKLLTDMNEYMR